MRLKFFCTLFFLVIIYASGLAQQSSYYVVVGAFRQEENAQHFQDHVLSLNLPAIYALNPETNLFYVYVRNTENKGDAYTTLKDMHVEGIRDAWIYKGFLPGHIARAEAESILQDSEKNTTIAETSVETETIPEKIVVAEETPPIVEEPATDTKPVSEDPSPVAETAKIKPAGKPFMFKLLNGETGSSVNGVVRLQEADRANQFRGVNGNELVYVVAPKNRSGKWYMVCQVIGFKEYRKTFTYVNPQKEEDVEIGQEQEIIFPVKLTRVRKGDYIEMESVKFYTNSNVLTPDSERELTELVAMMTENPEYRIRLHGHTNGNNTRDIISLAEGKSFFVMDPDNKKSVGSAKDLSTLMAETIKNYLISKGIDGDRMSVRGEGGKLPAYDPKGTMAAHNDRIEVEITQH